MARKKTYSMEIKGTGTIQNGAVSINKKQNHLGIVLIDRMIKFCAVTLGHGGQDIVPFTIF
jgi:hypothetical protein